MNKITRFEEQRIARFTGTSEGVKPEAVYPGWTNFVSQKSVRAIAMAIKSSCLWIATTGGVIAWKWKDNQPYQRYSSEHGMAGNEVVCLCLDEKERPWVGHSEGGLSYFDGQRWQVYFDLQTETVRALTGAGNYPGIWVAGQEMVYYIPEPSQPPKPVSATPDVSTADTLALLVDDKQLLIGNPWGLFQASHEQAPEQIVEEIQSCTALAKDRSGRIWIGTPTGLCLLENNKVEFWDDKVSGRVLAIAVSEKRIWILTSDGLFQIQENVCLQVPVSEQPVTIRAIAASTSDSYLWVGTDQLLAGVQVINPSHSSWYLDLLTSDPDDILYNFGRCVISKPNSEQVWVGTVGGLFTYQSTNKKWQFFSNNNEDIRALALNSTSNTFWILSWPNGMDKRLLDGSRADYNPVPQPLSLPLLLAMGQDGHPYVLTERALWRLTTVKTEEVVPSSPSGSLCMLQYDGVWWIGTSQGLYRLMNGKWQLVGDQPGPLEAAVCDLAVIENTLCVATANGLWTLKNSQWVQHNLKLPSNFPLVWVVAPSIHFKAIWLACEDGVVCYDPFSRNIREHYTCINSGLASRRVTALVESTHVLWIVTQAGISCITLN
ncbi:hypothetical protein [Scytonema sp. NUACC26]|uniref:ligand-binding sensor domain-containing protein n=1 Tax=Scytonema sp. NUACC26 TaxID=3140176 RepID=UPI0034DC3C2E